MNLDFVLFQLFPYVALALFLEESIRRYRGNRFSYSSLSSQFLEGDQLFTGSVPWHYAILWVLTGHLVAFLVPRSVLAWNAVPLRLYILEISALVGGITALVGVVYLLLRRIRYARIGAVTSVMDIVTLLVLLAQVGLGVYIATMLHWGSNWYAIVMAPYLWSVFRLQPDTQLLSLMPLAAKLHVLGAWTFVALLPFSRMVHFLVVPWQYVWRPYQLVIWNRDPKRALS